MLHLLLRNYGILNLKYKTMKAKMQRGGLTATNRKIAMTALGIKPKSKEFDPSTFGDKASVGTTRKKHADGGPTLGPVYSGPTGGKGGAGTSGPQKQPTRITGKMQMGGVKKKKKSSTPPEFNTPIEKPEVSTTKKVYKSPIVARIGSYFTGKENQKSKNPVTGMNVTRTYEKGKKTRVIKSKDNKEVDTPSKYTNKPDVKRKGGSMAKTSMMKMGGAKKK
jgi:hypothetical protein